MKKYIKFMAFAMMAVFSLTLVSCGDDDDELSFKQDYDVIQINGEKYACYGNRCPMTCSSDWDCSTHSGTLNLPCGKLSDAQKGEYDYDYLYSINLDGEQNLKKGSKLEVFSPELEVSDGGYVLFYESGSATITDKKDNKYVIVKFVNLKFSNSSKSYTFNGTVQLDLDEKYQATDVDIKSLCPNTKHPHAINMGAAGIWSCCNVGANSPEESGGYYAWGETEEKDSYGEEKYYNGQIHYDIGGEKFYDVAAAKLGGRWRMPSYEKICSLVDNCSYKWAKLKDVYGALFTASNGNKIFLPAAGSWNYTDFRGQDSYGNYWSSAPKYYDSFWAYDLQFDARGQYWSRDNGHNKSPRYFGESVRPVSE